MISTNIGSRSALIDVNATGSVWFETILTEALTIYTFSIIGTVKVSSTKNIHVHLFTICFRVGFCHKSLWTFTCVARRCIFTNCMFCTRIFQCRTFIDVRAAFVWISRKIRFTRAYKTANGVGTNCILSARFIDTLIYIWEEDGNFIIVWNYYEDDILMILHTIA